MTPRSSLWAASAVAAGAAVAFAWFVRLPLPFPGFAVVAAGGLAALGTLALIAWMPPHWVWHDSERLLHAFQARHSLSAEGAASALSAITMTHDRADALRRSAGAMRDDVQDQVIALADRLDAAAREIFYVPSRLRALRAVLIRSELIEEAAAAHATLRGRKQAVPEDTSRKKLLAAVDALDAAFDETDLLAARGLLQEVEIASDVAERVLTPRRGLTPVSKSDPAL